MAEDLAERVDAVLADAEDALTGTDDGGSDEASPRLRAVATAAAGLVEEADADALLSAVGLGGEDGYDSLPTALAKGDEERVLALERLLKLSALADDWEGSDATDRRAELTDLFDVDVGSDGDTTETPANEDESDADAAEDETDDGGVVSSAADEVVDAVVEEFAGDDGADGDDAKADDEAATTDEDTDAAEDDGSLRGRVEAAAADLRDGLDEVRGEDADEAGDDGQADDDGEADDDGDQRPTERLSTMPEHGRNPTHLSTMPDGESSTRFSTMPKRR